ncbi:glycoside hydrolase family 18 protein [Botryobasidium botryosum FD-172 SS1]|uniref:Glycoside hydrolase family 18 protein n=1 Tax=Botryobasidium botryosum (strain FD-172 SS1) TaxID=930990 RepID=A0A067MGK8_BOTB1|nr:glycoside hydrolase family 18 protein [Botryobasidium botryosum FD-172 SS1]
MRPSIVPLAIASLLSLSGALAATGNAGAGDAKGHVATAWYTSWHAAEFPLEKVSWKKYTALTYAFATPSEDPSVITLAPVDQQLLPNFVAMAHKNNVKALVSIGGWTGSIHFSTAVSTADNRALFVKAITDMATQYKLDGIDFDWEYPNRQGIGCNNISPNDTPNFLELLHALRSAAPKDFILTAAVYSTPFADASGAPSSDVSAFAKVLNHIAIMNYDIWGTFSATVGPNAPLDDSCALPAQQEGSAMASVRAWTAAGFPINQIVLAVASYGHSMTVTPEAAYSDAQKKELALYPAFDASSIQPGDRWDDAPGTDACGNEQQWGGNWNFWGLIDGGFLTEVGKPASGIAYRYDACSQTPFVYNSQTQIMVSFDNAQSFAAKGAYIKKKGLRGFAMWEAAGDHNDILLDSIRGAIGF